MDVDPALLDQGGVRLAVDGALATVTLDRPSALNAQTPSTWAALRAIGASLADPVRVVIVRGEGRSFSAGMDRRMFTLEGVPGEESVARLAGLPLPDLLGAIEAFQAGFSWLRRDDLVTIAAVQGHAIGAGFQLALACDLRVVADDVQLAMRETSLGLVPDLTGTHPLVALVGYARALELCATGRFVGATEALAWGLANAAVPADELDDAARDLAAAVLSAPAAAVRALKPLLAAAPGQDLAAQLELERRSQAGLLTAMAAALKGPGG